VSTPIGNLADITLRALHVLSIVDYIACEDTRHTAQLLQAYNIKAKTIACHMHNQQQASQTVLNHLAQGLKIAYVSDAGTPCISDPGSILVEQVINAGFKVIPISGISTPTTLISVAGIIDKNNSGLPAYCFAGFLPTNQQARLKYLQKLSNYKMPVAVFESPNRIEQTLQDLNIDFTGRKLIIGRELTKQFEEIIYTKVGADISITKKGEFCLILGASEEQEVSNELVHNLLSEMLPHLGTKQSSIVIANALNISQKEIYNQALALKAGLNEDE
jgi:16S rRNA (cytidine1402-2'-O)-methyltransferase